jgi:TatD DNase family protein
VAHVAQWQSTQRKELRGSGSTPDVGTMEIIDIGINLTHASFREDRDAVVARARAAGVTQMILTGTSLPGSRRALELARQYGLYATCGVHPHDAKNAADVSSPRGLASLRELAADPRCVAVGECGLDFDRDFSPRPIQESVFESQLALAAENRKPVFLHERAAHDRFTAILSAHRPQLSNAVVHCFTGSERELDAYLALDCHIGITGWICDERRGKHLYSLLPRIPLERLMIETDAPFLIPRNLKPRPNRNEPALLIHVLSAVAAARKLPVEEVAAATTRNARRFFALE